MSAEIRDAVERLKKLDIGEDVYQIVSVAGQVLDSCKEEDSIIAQLLEMEKDWKEENEKHWKAMVTFLERYGIIPMGSAS